MYLQLAESGGRGQGGVLPPQGSQSRRGSPGRSGLRRSKAVRNLPEMNVTDNCSLSSTVSHPFPEISPSLPCTLTLGVPLAVTWIDLLVQNRDQPKRDVGEAQPGAQSGGQHSCRGTGTVMCQPTNMGEQKGAPAQPGF